MVRDREAFRERFRQYKEGKSVVDIYDLPRYENGKFNESTKKKIDYYYDWLIHNGFDPISAVGILGNMMQESSLNPNSSNSLGYKGLLLNSKAIQLAIINQYNDHSEQSQLRYLSDWTDGATWIRKGPYAKDTALYSKSYLRKGYKTPEESAFEFLKRYERAIVVDPKTKKPVLDEHGNYTYQDKDKRLRYARQIYNYVTGAKSLEELIKELEQSKPDATRVYNVPTILQESVPSTWLQQATELPASTFADAFERSKPLNLQRLVDLIEEYTPQYSKFKYEDGKISQGNKLIPIDELHGWARSHNADDPWYIRYTKNVTDDILNTLEPFTNPYRNTINGRMSIDDAISIGLDAGAGLGAKAIRKVAKAIKPTKSSISLKGKTPRELALYFELNPDLISDADPIKVAEAADFIKNDALPRVLREAKKRGRSVDFDPNTITFKIADFKDSKLGGISTPNKTVYMRKDAPTDHYVHEMSHEMRRATGETPEEASRLFSTYKNSEAFLKAHPEYALLLENEAVNTQLRSLISQANGGVKGKQLDSIIDNMPYDKFETYAILANAYTNDMARTGGLNRNTYKNTLKYVGATYPMLYAASLLKKHANGKLPGFEDGYKYSWDDSTKTWNRYTGDLMGQTFNNFVATPQGSRDKFNYEKLPLPQHTPNVESPEQYTNRRILETTNNSTPITDTFNTAVGFIPGVSDVRDIALAGYQAVKGNYGEAAILGGLAVLPNAIENPGKALMKTGLKYAPEFTKNVYDIIRLYRPKDNPRLRRYANEFLQMYGSREFNFRRRVNGAYDDGKWRSNINNTVAQFLHSDRLWGFYYKNGTAYPIPVRSKKEVLGYNDEVYNQIAVKRNLPSYNIKETMYHETAHSTDIGNNHYGENIYSSLQPKDPQNAYLSMNREKRARVLSTLSYMYNNGVNISDVRDISQAMTNPYIARIRAYLDLINKYNVSSDTSLPFVLRQSFKDGKLPEYKNGKIYIKPANRGKFNATKKRTGKTTEELTHSKNPITRKRAIFALNSRKWHHK